MHNSDARPTSRETFERSTWHGRARVTQAHPVSQQVAGNSLIFVAPRTPICPRRSHRWRWCRMPQTTEGARPPCLFLPQCSAAVVRNRHAAVGAFGARTDHISRLGSTASQERGGISTCHRRARRMHAHLAVHEGRQRVRGGLLLGRTDMKQEPGDAFPQG